MSTYVRHKVLRYPMSKEELAQATNLTDLDDVTWELEQKFPSLVDYATVGKFYWGMTYPKTFLDYTVEYDYDNDCGDWGKVRELYDTERCRAKEIFEQLLPIVDETKIRLVDYCYYNSSEAPDYYSMDKNDDPFYKEVKL